MSPTVTILESNSSEAQQRWAKLRTSSSNRHAFDSLALVARLTAAQSMESRAIFVNESGTDLAAFLATFRRVGPFFEVVPPRLVPFSPMVLRSSPEDPDPLSNAVAALRAHLVDRYHRVVITLPPELEKATALLGPGWKSDSLKTYVLPLQETSVDVTTDWSASTRRLYRKHARQLTVDEDPSATSAILALWIEAYARSGTPLEIDTKAMEDTVAWLHHNAGCRVFSAVRPDGGFEGGLVVLMDGDTAYYWIAGSVPGPAMTVILGRVIQLLKAEGVTAFDFLGANTPSIAEFKRRFGPQLIEYPRLIASRSRIFEAMLSAKHSLSERTASL
ncbi:MAG: GNAT family N-acetyltransferase [Rhodothermia bacterium]|nr:GNAT family N-acetyltransferase [Rhodothermia bacterium]